LCFEYFNSVADPGSRMRKNADLDPGMNIPDHFSESLETFLGLKIFKFFYEDPGSGIFFDLNLGLKNLDPG
jgi:hypothetical protein